MYRYVETKYYQRTEDWYYEPPITLTEYPSNECDEDDFGSDPASHAFFEDWAGFILVCPDVEQRHESF